MSSTGKEGGETHPRNRDGAAPAPSVVEGGERAVSPVIGVALMIGITVMLAMVIAPVVFMMSGEAGDRQPTTDFAFSYAEAVDEGEIDSFGNDKTDVAGTGLVTIVYDKGDDIPIGQLEIQGAASSGELSSAPEYEDQTQFVPGQSISVWAQRGEEIQIVWTSEDGSKSAILDTFAVRPSADLPVYVPEPDGDCDWVEDQLNNNDLVVDDTVVECDLDQYNIDNVDIQNGGVVIGNVTANQDVTLDNGETFLDDVTAGNDLTLRDGSTIDGTVRVGTDGGGDLTLDDSDILGHGTVDGAAELIDGAMSDELDATGAVSLDDSTVSSSVISQTEISLDGESTIVSDVDLPDVGTDLDCRDGDLSTVAGMGCLEYKSPTFEVTIQNTNTPVEGDELEVSVLVENTGFEDGSQDIRLEITGNEEDAQSVSVNSGAETTIDLLWDTDDGDAGTYEAVVESEDDFDDETVQVASSDRELSGIEFEADGNTNSVDLNRDDSIPYTVTAAYDDGSTDDVTDQADLTIISGDEDVLTIDEAAATITGDTQGTVTIEAEYSEGDTYTDTVDVTVREPMDERLVLVSADTGTGPFASFEMENQGPGDVEIESISVNYVDASSGNIDKVDNDGDNEVEGGGTYVNVQSIEVGGTDESFFGLAVVTDGATETFDIQEFRQDNGNERTVVEFGFTLYFSDGSEEFYDTDDL